MADTDNGQLMRLIGEISSDTKHILLKQDKQDARIDRIDARVRTVEKFQWKLMGIATAIPVLLSGVGLYLKS
jgi:hypothetical protein